MTAKQIILESPILDAILYDENILLLDKNGYIKIFLPDEEEVGEEIYRIEIKKNKVNPKMYVHQEKLVILTETQLQIINFSFQNYSFDYKTQGRLDTTLSCMTDEFIFFIETINNKTILIRADLNSTKISKIPIDSCKLIHCINDGIVIVNTANSTKLSINRKNSVNSIDLKEVTQFVDFFEKPGKNKIDRLLFNKEREELLSGMLAWYLVSIDINSCRVKWVSKLNERVLGVSFFYQGDVYHCTMNSIYQIDSNIGNIIKKQDVLLEKWIRNYGAIKLIDKTEKFFLLLNTGSGEYFKIDFATFQMDDMAFTNSEFYLDSPVVRKNSDYFMIDRNLHFFKLSL